VTSVAILISSLRPPLRHFDGTEAVRFEPLLYNLRPSG